MSEYPTCRGLSDAGRLYGDYNCFCHDSNDSDSNNEGKFMRLGCRCVLHYHCLIQHIRFILGERSKMSLYGMPCPYGRECKSLQETMSRVYYITTNDLDEIVEYGKNHSNLERYLSDSNCRALTRDEVSGLREWIEERRKTTFQYITDVDCSRYTISTTKKCPTCGFRVSRYHSHDCHQIRSCPNCSVSYCYFCLKNGDHSKHKYCIPIETESDIRDFIRINDGGIPYDIRCGCVICSYCKYGKPCEHCMKEGGCCVCKGYVNPSPLDIDSEWVPEGPLYPYEEIGHTLRKFCKDGNSNRLANLLKQSSISDHVNETDVNGKTGLYFACSAFHIECVRLLVQCQDIDVNKAGDRFTPLHIAVKKEYTDIVSLLIDRSDDINIQTEKGYTPLHIVALNGNTEIVSLLIAKGAKISIQNIDGDTPLHYAVAAGHTEIVSLLISSGADISIQNNGGDTPLDYAIEKGHTEIVLLLKRKSADINIQSNDGDTPLHYGDVQR